MEEKISFFKRMLISIKDFEKYKIFAVEKLSKSFKYFFQFASIFVLIIAISFSIKYGTIINKTVNYIKNDLPDFVYENGILKLNSENPIELENDNEKDISYKIIIDTKTENEEEINKYKEKASLYNYGIVILNNKLIIKNSAIDRTIEKTYSDVVNNYGIPNSFNKQDLVNTLNSNQLLITYAELFVVIYIYLIISYSISILLDALILALLGVITARIVKLKIKFASSYAMAIHALTLPIILNVIYIIVNMFTGFYIKYFEIMYTTISYICMVAAILSIRSDLIKESIMVGKIKEVQNEIKEENKTNEEEEKKKDTENKEEKDEGNIEIDNKDKKENENGNPATGES